MICRDTVPTIPQLRTGELLTSSTSLKTRIGAPQQNHDDTFILSDNVRSMTHFFFQLDDLRDMVEASKLLPGLALCDTRGIAQPFFRQRRRGA
jgi:hypothetical protein